MRHLGAIDLLISEVDFPGGGLPRTNARNLWGALAAGFPQWIRRRCLTKLPSDSKWLQAGKNYFRIIFGGSTGKSCKSPRGYYRGGSYRTGAHTGDYFWGIIFGGSTGKSCNSPGAITWKNVYRIILVIISPHMTPPPLYASGCAHLHDITDTLKGGAWNT